MVALETGRPGGPASPRAPMTERTDDAILDTILSAYHLHARITDNMRYCGRWHDWDPQAPAGVAWFHLLGQGTCWLKTQAMDQPLRLTAGDLVVLPRGTPHTLTSVEEGENAGEASFTTMLCGEL